MQYPQNPQSVAHLLTTLATNQKNLEFICFCIESYFERLLSAPMKTLIHYGIRPVVAPMAAQAALERIEGMNYCLGWFHALIADDGEAAKLALRAIKTYSMHYSQMPLKKLKKELGAKACQTQKMSNQLKTLLIGIPFKITAQRNKMIEKCHRDRYPIIVT